MSNYSKIVDYAAKDLLLHGDPAKAIKGTEVGAEFDAIATMSATKGDKSGTLAQFAATTSLELKGVISDETGSGALVFATSPTLVTPALGTPASGTLTNCTGLPASAAVNTPAGSIAATTVQAAINELDTEKAALAGSASQAFEGSTLKAATTIGVGAATPAASGAGITFPATQSASSDANTLDDYEEGTWTATVADALAGGNTSTSGAGSYTKIGNRVTVDFLLDSISTVGLTAGNSLCIQGLPFAAVGNAVGSCYTYRVGRDAATVSSSMDVFNTQSALRIFLHTTSSATNDITILVSNLVHGTSSIYGTIVYKV